MGLGFDFIMAVPLLLSYCGFFFVFGCGVSFFSRFWHPPGNGCSATCDFSVLTGGDECTSFYSAILNQKHLSDTYVLLIITMEKAMASHSSTLAWKIPWMEEPGRL